MSVWPHREKDRLSLTRACVLSVNDLFKCNVTILGDQQYTHMGQGTARPSRLKESSEVVLYIYGDRDIVSLARHHWIATGFLDVAYFERKNDTHSCGSTCGSAYFW